MSQPIALSGPDITQAEVDAVVAVLRTPQLSLGPKVPAFEEQFTRRLGVRHAIALSSGTAGLHLLWRALEHEPGDEVDHRPPSPSSPRRTAPSSSGGRPVFVDIDPDSWQLDAALIEAAVTPRTKALLPVDVFGSTPDMEAIAAIAARHRLPRARGLAARRSAPRLPGAARRHARRRRACFGFYPNKQITTGEGGMVVTDDDDIARRVPLDAEPGPRPGRRAGSSTPASASTSASATSTAPSGSRRWSGWTRSWRTRTQVAALVPANGSRDEPRVRMTQVRRPRRTMSWFVFVVRLDDRLFPRRPRRDPGRLRDHQIGCSNYFTPIHLQPFYQRATTAIAPATSRSPRRSRREPWRCPSTTGSRSRMWTASWRSSGSCSSGGLRSRNPAPAGLRLDRLAT